MSQASFYFSISFRKVQDRETALLILNLITRARARFLP